MFIIRTEHSRSIHTLSLSVMLPFVSPSSTTLPYYIYIDII